MYPLPNQNPNMPLQNPNIPLQQLPILPHLHQPMPLPIVGFGPGLPAHYFPPANVNITQQALQAFHQANPYPFFNPYHVPKT